MRGGGVAAAWASSCRSGRRGAPVDHVCEAGRPWRLQVAEGRCRELGVATRKAHLRNVGRMFGRPVNGAARAAAVAAAAALAPPTLRLLTSPGLRWPSVSQAHHQLAQNGACLLQGVRAQAQARQVRQRVGLHCACVGRDVAALRKVSRPPAGRLGGSSACQHATMEHTMEHFTLLHLAIGSPF